MGDLLESFSHLQLYKYLSGDNRYMESLHLKRKGFTLIELLVVIAIIALLLSILMPSLAKVKMVAEEVICKSNLHQYALATEIYSHEQQDRYPNAWASLYSQGGTYSGEPERFCRWHNESLSLENRPDYAGPLWPYLETTKVSVCPTFNRFSRQFGTNHPSHNNSIPVGKVNFGYSMNAYITTGRAKGTKKTEIKSSPSQTFLWAEENMWRMKDKSGTILSNWVLNDNALLVGNAVDSFGSFHKISIRKYGSQMPKGTATHGTYTSGGVNALLMDGSSIYVTPEDSRQYMGKRR